MSIFYMQYWAPLSMGRHVEAAQAFEVLGVFEVQFHAALHHHGSRIPRHHKSTLPPPDRAVERLLRIK